jgi:mono/diheme cytochrome c family protein
VTGRALLAAALIGWLAAVSLACGGGGAPLRGDSGPAASCASRLGLPSSEASARLIEGARVFGERCSPCHGEQGFGDGVLADLLPLRPRNYHAERFRWGTSWRDIERTVRLGRSDVMPSFEGALEEPEIRSVAFLVACWVAQREAE